MPISVKPTLPASPPESVEKSFRQLAESWNAAVAYQSSTTIRNSHPAYREIIALGPIVIPLLLADMETNHSHWFCALREITGANPVSETIAGNVPKMVQAWLAWAKENGYGW